VKFLDTNATNEKSSHLCNPIQVDSEVILKLTIFFLQSDYTPSARSTSCFPDDDHDVSHPDPRRCREFVLGHGWPRGHGAGTCEQIVTEPARCRAVTLRSLTYYTLPSFVGRPHSQFDVGTEVRTAVENTPTPAPGPAPAPIVIITSANVIFYHDNVVAAPTSGSYDVDYYYAGCITPMPVGIDGITDVVNGATADPIEPLDTLFFVSKCGINDNAPCAQKTTYKYVVQQLDQITDPTIKTVSAPSAGLITTEVKFCIRHRMLSSTGQENGYKQADVTFKWKKTSGGAFSGTVTTDVNDADNETLDVGTVTVAVVRCATVASPPSTYQQGEEIQLCLSASASTTAVVTIVKVNTLRFWIDIAPDGNAGVYDLGETTQVGMANGLPAGTTTILPANAGTGGYCTQSFGSYYPPSSSTTMTGKGGCVLSTFLGSAFFVPGATSTTITTVQYAGTVTIEFGDGSNRRRRVLSLRGDHHHRSEKQVSVGEPFDKPYTSSVMIASADRDCSGFFLFKIICWFFKCLLGFK
jgi:hypothetical protein